MDAKKAGHKTYVMAKKVGGGAMKIPRVQVNLVSMLKNVKKCDFFSTKLFQLQIPKIVSHLFLILETKKLGLSVEEELHLSKFAMRYLSQFER